jgi:hypothetical protein
MDRVRKQMPRLILESIKFYSKRISVKRMAGLFNGEVGMKLFSLLLVYFLWALSAKAVDSKQAKFHHNLDANQSLHP